MLEIFLQFAAAHILYLALCLQSGSFPRPLTAQQEREAFAAMAAGDAAARDCIIRHNLRLVAHIAKKYYAACDDRDDLIGLGTVGLIKAVSTFDSARRARFSTYASRCIENEIRMQLRRQRKEPPTASLSEPLEGGGEDGRLRIMDVLADDFMLAQSCEEQDERSRLLRAVDALPAREKQVLTLRYGLGGRPAATQQQAAAQLGISRSYVSRIEKRALETLRARWTTQNF